jgi:hypothetical protein
MKWMKLESLHNTASPAVPLRMPMLDNVIQNNGDYENRGRGTDK